MRSFSSISGISSLVESLLQSGIAQCSDSFVLPLDRCGKVQAGCCNSHLGVPIHTSMFQLNLPAGSRGFVVMRPSKTQVVERFLQELWKMFHPD